ncbi:MAG: cytochrome c nitrite reductase small subunit [Sulfurospirillum sp.]|nr:cytochrome c nitrite reductase small subunit [Sulfurospirillum sp.]MBL0703596.1 cytochrome c nitrite reductase small subunit [Sulfurospirillum sp.]
MKKNKLLVYSALTAFVVAIAMFVYVLNTSKALSYLSSDPKACINCHVMNTQYATWQHSSHGQVATCVECHLPTDEGMFAKYVAKAKDGWNHSYAFTMNTYDNTIKISDDGAKRVQNNCIKCHQSVTSTLVANSDKYHQFEDPEVATGRKCWSCHKGVPHGKVRGLSTTPNNLGIKEVK